MPKGFDAAFDDPEYQRKIAYLEKKKRVRGALATQDAFVRVFKREEEKRTMTPRVREEIVVDFAHDGDEIEIAFDDVKKSSR
jgi:hypothetical protein